MLRERIEHLLNVRSDEWVELIFFWLFNTLLWTGLAIGEAVSETLFLKRVGVEFLPHMFIICSVFSLPLGFLFGVLQQRLGRMTFSIGLGSAAALLVTVCAWLIQSGVSVSGFPVGAPILYVVQYILSTVLATHFSIILAGQFTTLDAKRLVPLILSGSISGAMIGGFLVKWLARPVGVPGLLWIWILLLVAALAWFLLFCLKFFPSNWGNEDREQTPKYVGEGWLEKLSYETRAVFGSPLLLLLSLSALFMTISKFFIEYQYSEIFGAHFPQESDLASFFGTYVIFSNCVALAFQSLITGRMIQSLGVSNANLFYPVSTFVAFLGVAVSPTLLPGIFARFNQEGFFRAVFQPVNTLFYNAIPPKRRARSIAFNEGLVIPLGSVCAGLLLMLIKDSRLAFSLLSVGMAAVWVGLVWGQRQVYSQSLLDLLKRSQIEGLNQDEKGLGTLDPQTQSLVLEALKDPQDEVAELAADILIRYGSPHSKMALLRTAPKARPSLQILLIRKLVHFPSPDTREFLMNSLHSPEEDVRLATLEALITYPHDEQIRLTISDYLETVDPRQQAAAAAAVVRGGDLVQMMKALLVLQRLIFSKKPDEIALGIRTLGLTRDERFWVNLRPYLASPNPDIRLAAMRSMNLMVRAGEVYEHLDILHRLIHDSVREIRSYAIQIVGRIKASGSVHHLIDALSDSSPRNRRLAFESLSNFGPEVVPDLLMILEDPKATIFAQEGAVRLLNLSQDPSLKERLTRFGFQKIRQVYDLKLDELTLGRQLSPGSAEFMATVLSEKAQGLVRLVLALVAPEQDHAARTLFKSLYSPNEEMMSNAIEVLQTMGERTLIYHLLPVLEGLPLPRIAEYGMRVFNLESRSPRMVLGRHLLCLDEELREAAIYTIGTSGTADLSPALQKLKSAEGNRDSLRQLCEWSLDQLAKAALFSDQNPLAAAPDHS